MSLIEQNISIELHGGCVLIEPNHTDGIPRAENGSQMPQRRIKKGEATKIVTVRMAESDYARIQEKAEASGVRVSEYIRALLLDTDRLRDMVTEAEKTTARISAIFSAMTAKED